MRKNIFSIHSLFEKTTKNSYIIKEFFKNIPTDTIYKIKFLFNFKKMKLQLDKKIKNQRILILGSGPSAMDLKNIPSDVKVFTCKRGPEILVNNNLNKDIDLYYCRKIYFLKEISKNLSLFNIISKAKIDLFITDNVELVKSICNCAIWDRSKNNYFLKKLIKPKKIKDIGKNGLHRTSIGSRLLQYAVFFQAREIYLIGIDLGEGGHFWNERTRLSGHTPIDLNFIKLMSKKYGNIYSISKKSPITRYIPFKEMI